jgi:anthranilate phosphoribosyltransferase
MDNAIRPLISQAANGVNLSTEQAARAFQIIMNGGATPAQIAALLVALHMKGESIDEITGAVTAVRAKATPFHAPAGTIDTCGTGGDGKGSLNISTAVALVLAGCGLPVAKHGNRAVSSRSGSADVLEMLGVKIDAPTHVMERMLAEHNFCFLFAPLYHKAMRHVAPVRQELGMRTIFNLIGPLANPAQPTYQLLGVYSPLLVEPLAWVLKQLGVKNALVVHGAGGMDELSLSGPSMVAELKEGEVFVSEILPEDAGIQRSNEDALKGGDAGANADALRKLLMGEKSAYRDAVLLNAAAALIVAEKAQTMTEGAELAAHAIDEGHAYTTLQRVIDASRASAA